MQDPNADAGAKKEATDKVEKVLEESFAEVQTPSDASKTLDKVEATGSGLEEKDIPAEVGSADPVKQAEAIEAAADSATSKNRPAAVLATAAIQLASAPPDKREPLDEGIRKAGGPSAAKESPEVKKGRDLLRKELLSRLKPLDAIDATLFVQINHLPHPKRARSPDFVLQLADDRRALVDSLYRRERLTRQEACGQSLSYSSRFVSGHIYCRDTDQEVLPTETSVHFDRPRYCCRAQTWQLFISIGT